MSHTHHRILAPLLVLLLAVGACRAPVPETAVQLPQRAQSAAGVVSAAHPLAAQAGAQMLELGGTAVDAAVAAAFTLAVVEPSMSGLGGRVQILVRTPDGEHYGIDGTTQAPASYDPDEAPQARAGYAVIGVPGVPAGLLKAHQAFGTLPRATVMEPAIRFAEEGFELLPGEAARQAAALERLVQEEDQEGSAPVMAEQFGGTRAAFLKPDGTPHRAGEILRQPDLARTLRAIEEGGADAFYRGEIARVMAEDMARFDAPVTLEALAAYEALDSRVVRGSYRGHDLVGLWLPAYGAITIEILHLLETLQLSNVPEADWARALSEAIRVAYEDRYAQEDWEDAERLTSKAYAAERAREMSLGVAAAAAAAPVPDGQTTHLSVADGGGMVVALTQSLGPSMGSGVVTDGLGFLYAATLGGYLGRMEPRERAKSHISPFMLERDGLPFLTLGAAGGGRIPTAIVAAVSRMVDRGMSLEEALTAPRIVPDGPSGGDAAAPGLPRLEVEAGTGMGFGPEAVDRLEALGYEVEVTERVGAFGRIHAVRWLADPGVWEGVADPDWEGAVAVPRAMVR